MEQSQEVELRTLSVIRRKSNYHKYRSLLQASFFELESTRQVFQLIDEFFKEDKHKVRKLTVANLKLIIHQKVRNAELLKETLNIANTLKNYKTLDNPVIEETLQDFVKRQYVKKGILAGLEELNNANPDFTKIQSHIDKAMLIGSSLSNQFYSYFEDPEERMVYDHNVKRVVTGIPLLDEAIDGGFSYGELVVILAPPERGKTLTLVNFGVAALHQGMTVGYLTLELSERKVARRFDLRITGRPINLLREDPGRIRNPLAALRKTGCDLVIKDYSADTPRIEDIKSFVVSYQAKMKKKFDILLIDYADLISPTKNYKQERFGLKEVYTNLRRLANELKIPIVTASQANRKSMDKKIVSMEDFDECFAKAAIADIILGLCQDKEEREDGICRIFIAKNRSSGAHKTIRLTMKPKIMFMGEFDRGSDLKKVIKKSVADRI